MPIGAKYVSYLRHMLILRYEVNVATSKER